VELEDLAVEQGMAQIVLEQLLLVKDSTVGQQLVQVLLIILAGEAVEQEVLVVVLLVALVLAAQVA
jgi:hypothetical protein